MNSFFMPKLLILIGLGTLINFADAHIHRIEHWSNDTQSLYLIHDFHESLYEHNQVCDQQQDDLVVCAQQYNAFVIVEDMSVHNNKLFFSDPYNYDSNTQRVSKKRKKHPAKRPPLVGLTTRCHDQKIPVNNIEFRQAGIASQFGENISAKQVFGISNKARNEISNYNDCPILNDYYRTEIARYDQNISNASDLFGIISSSEKTLKELIPKLHWCKGADAIIESATHTDERGATIWDKVARRNMAIDLYDMRLLDARIMHFVYQNKDYPCIFVCVGSDHIRHIRPVVKDLGYRCDGIIGQSYVEKYGNTIEPDALNLVDAFSALPKPVVPDRSVTPCIDDQPATPQQKVSSLHILLLLLIALVLYLLPNRKKRARN